MRPHSSPRGLGQRGFTLIEVMVVVVILGLLATMVTKNVIQQADHAKVQKAAVDCKQIAEAAKLFYLHKGHVPTLEQLRTRDEKGQVCVENLGLDPWDGEYVLRPGEARGELEVRSAGPDRIEGDEDDITSSTVAH